MLREVAEELGLEGRLASTIGIYPFERLNQVIFVYHVVVPDDEPITLAADELDDYKEVPLEKLRPWPQGTGPGAARLARRRAATIRRSSISARRSSSEAQRRRRLSGCPCSVNVKSLNCEVPSVVCSTALFGFSPQCQ